MLKKPLKMSVLYFFLILSILLALAISQYCPPPEDIYPCTCRAGVFHTLSIQCSGLKSISDLQPAIKSLQKKDVSLMTINKSNLTRIPANAFEGVKISDLYITDSEITMIGNLGEQQFKGQEETLETITITKSFKESDPLAYLSLGHLKKLYGLNFNGNYVGFVNNKWFIDGPVSLKTLSFQEAKIQVIAPRAFVGLTNLSSLDMCRNEITYISPFMFPNPAQLTSLDFSFNKLSSLPEDLFLGMPKLSSVNFELNELTTISENVWSPIWKQIEYLNMEYNPLECDSKIKWIYDKGNDFVSKIVAECYKPFRLMERTLDSLTVEELG